MPADFDSLFPQIDPQNRPRNHQRRGEPAGKMTASGNIVEPAVPHKGGVIGVGGTRLLLQLGIIS